MDMSDLFNPNVERLKAKGDVKGLIKLLKDKKDWSARLGAAEALGDIGDATAVKPLIQALKDENSDVRMGVAWALGKIPDTTAVEFLIQALKDENRGVRSEAARALRDIRDTRAVEPLIQALKDIGVEAAEALINIGDERAV